VARNQIQFGKRLSLPVHIQADIVGMFGCDCKAVSGGRLHTFNVQRHLIS
jgi:hypothetical protein